MSSGRRCGLNWRISRNREELEMYIILSVILAVIGIVMVWKPKSIYDLTESWKSSTGGEPSDLYLFSTRMGGVLCLLAGIIGIVVLGLF